MIAFAAARHHGDRITGAVVANTVLPGVAPWSHIIADPRIWHFALHAVPKLPETLVTRRERAYFDYFFDLLAGDKAALSDPLRRELTRAYERPEALRAGFDWYRAFEQDAKANAEPKRLSLPPLSRSLRHPAGGQDASSRHV
jgi:pimeloyl-ACP methyl ester carboxylesterase